MNASFMLEVEKIYFVRGCVFLSRCTRLLCWVFFTMCLASPASGKDAEIIVSFEESSSIENWNSINDGVMGGVSKGGFERTERKTLLFTGELSLENNGGFASIRTKPSNLNMVGASGIIVKACGDGRTYWVGLQTDRQMRASSYRAYLETTKGECIETFIPLSDFKLQAFGRPVLGDPLEPSALTSIGFTIADKNAGPFKLEIEYIKSVFEDAKPLSRDLRETIVDVATNAGMFKTLLAAATAADLAEPLSGKSLFTVFAPTDEAFSRLPMGTLENLLKPENKQQLVDLLKYHVVEGQTTLSVALERGTCLTLQGGALSVTFADGRVRIGSATLVEADISASNGLIHVVDQVLVPPKVSVHSLTPAMLIELAIERGVPLFNNGDAEACVSLYEITCEALRIMPGVSEESRQDLNQALVKMRVTKMSTQKAWILRHALDRVSYYGTERK